MANSGASDGDQGSTVANGTKIAVITGGTKGIGLCFSQRLVKVGYQVIALYRNDDSAAAAATVSMGYNFVALKVDISNSSEVMRATDAILDKYGPPAVLVNNAGRNIDRPFLDLSIAEWDAVIATNLNGPFYMARSFASAMLAAGGGAIVNIGATTAIRPRRNGANYCASKAGLLHLTKCLALELAPTIRVNALIPGMIDTEEMRTRYMVNEPPKLRALLDEIPQGRIGYPEEMADALVFLISNDAKYVTGQKLIVDGGQFMW